MCIQVCAYVHACACVVVSVRERKSERESVCEIVFYVSQLAYTQRGVWKRSCACKCVDKQDYNKTYQHTVSLCECARDRDRQRDRQQKSACVMCLSACTLFANTFTHTAGLPNSSRLPIDKCMHAMHTLDACMLMHFILKHTLSLCLSLCLPLSLFKFIK